jgi:HEAT repeat protein
MSDRTSFDSLVAQPALDDPRAVAQAARSLAQLDDPRGVQVLIELLLETPTPIVWNAAALALRDLGDSRAVAPLLKRLGDPATEDARGTLVHALGGFDGGPFVERLVDLVISGNYEVGREAAGVIEAIESPVANEVREACVARLRDGATTAAPERRELLVEGADLLSASA